MSATTADEASTRAHKVHAVLSELRAQGQATKSELAKACGVSRPTIAGILDDLQASGLVTALQSTTAGGRPAQTYGFAPKAGVVVAIDI